MASVHYFRQRQVYILYEFASFRREAIVSPPKIYRTYKELQVDYGDIFPTARFLLKFIRNHCEKTGKRRPRTPAGVPRSRRECLHVQRARIDVPVFSPCRVTKNNDETKETKETKETDLESELDFAVDQL